MPVMNMVSVTRYPDFLQK